MDTLSLERRLLGKFENTKQDSEWFSEVFNLKSILDTALNRDFLFSNWMNSYQNALHFENEHSKELGVILDLIVHVADILDDFQDGAKEMDGGEQLNEAVFILVFCIHTIQERPLPLKVKEQLQRTVTQNMMSAFVGQQRDLTNVSETTEQYLTMVKEKAGTFFKLATDMLLTVATEPVDKALWNEASTLSTNLGIYNQMLNDVDDFLTLGEDIRNRRHSLPVLFSLGDHNLLVTKYYQGQLTYDDLKENEDRVHQEIQRSGVLSYCQYYLLYYEKQCLRIIEKSIFLKNKSELYPFIKRRN
ncbi:octaprenyl diphosphate synthase [Bacillus sp. JCM 19047]|nr:octaprenyl diphosphate synthase [Bacillus sp. JCM 19047]